MNDDRVTMAADSTQKGEPNKLHETPFQKRANKRKRILQERRAKKMRKSQAKKQKNRSHSRQRSRSRGDSDSDCESDLDLRKDLKPVGHYVHHREEMLEHMFRSISSKKLKAMMPECVKELNIAELKTLCLEQLDMMSRKRILRVLDGADPDTISSTDTEDDSSEEEEEQGGEGVEEEDHESVGGSSQGSAAESVASEVDPPDASQSQHIDSTSLQEEQISEGNGSPVSNASAAEVEDVSEYEDEEAGMGEEVQEEKGEGNGETVLPAGGEADGEKGEDIDDEQISQVKVEHESPEQPPEEENGEETVDNVVQEDDQEEGEVQEEEEMETEDTADVKLATSDVKGSTSTKKEGEVQDMEELQLDVPRAEMEGLLGSGNQSPEEGEVFDDDSPPMEKSKKQRSHRSSTSKHASSKSRSKDSRSRKSSRSQGARPPTKEKTERTSESNNESKVTSRKKGRSTSSSESGKRSRSDSGDPHVKKVKSEPQDSSMVSKNTDVSMPAGKKKGETLEKVDKDTSKVASNKPVRPKQAAANAPISPSKIPLPETKQVQPKEAHAKTEDSGDISNIGRAPSSKALEAQQPKPKESKPTFKKPPSLPSKDPTPVQSAPKECDSDVQIEAQARAILEATSHVLAMSEATDLSKTTPKKSPIAQKGKTVPLKTTPSTAQTLAKSAPIPTVSPSARSVLKPKITLPPNPPLPPPPQPQAHVATTSKEQQKKVIKLKRPVVATPGETPQVRIVGQTVKGPIEQPTRTVEPPKVAVEKLGGMKVPSLTSRVVVKREPQETRQAQVQSDEPQRRIQLKGPPQAGAIATTGAALHAPSRSVVQSSPVAPKRKILKRPHSTSTLETAVPIKTTPGGQDAGNVAGQGTATRTVIKRSSSTPTPVPLKEEGEEEGEEGEELSPNRMEILELEMRARAIKAMLKAKK